MVSLCWLDINASYSHSSLALPAIEANDSTESIEWRRVSGTTKTSIDEVLSELTSNHVDLLCATAWLFTHDYLLEVLERFHAMSPRTTIFLGGPEFLGDNRDYLLNHPFIRLVHKGEAEESFFTWFRMRNNPSEWVSVEGLCYYDADGTYHDNGIAVVSDFAALTPPSQSRFFPFSKPFVQFETSRGCYNSCAFCVSGGESVIQSLSLEQIRRQLDLFTEKGIREIRLLDRTFNSNSRRAVDMLTLFESYTGRLSFHLEMHPALLTEALRTRLDSLPAGLLHLEAGVQSLNERSIELVSRKGSVAKTLEGLDFLCGLHTMETHVDLIVGLPEYTLSQLFDDTIRLMRTGAAEIQIELLKLLPGTRLRREADHLGIRYNSSPPYEVLFTPDLTSEEAEEAMVLSRAVDLFFNDHTFQSLFQTIVTTQSTYWLRQFVSYARQNDLFACPEPKERRAEHLISYIKKQTPAYLASMQQIWLMAGFSLYRLPYAEVKPYKKELPAEAVVIHGQYHPNQRLYTFTDAEGRMIFVGFDRSIDPNCPRYIGVISLL